MVPEEQRSRFRVWLAQAERFAETDNHIDAVARVRLIVEEVEQLLEERPENEALRREQAFFEKQLKRFEARYLAWQSEVAMRAEAHDSYEKQIYKADKPGGRLG